MKKINIVLLVVIAGVFAFAFTFLFLGDLMNEASMYATFDDARNTDKKVHIVGSWVDRDNYLNEPNLFEFSLKDTVGEVQRVRSYNPMPPSFESAEKVVVVGGYEDEQFVADKIIMKCPSKYNEKELASDKGQNMKR